MTPTRGLGQKKINITGRVGSGRVLRFSNSHGSGRVTVTRPGPTWPARFDPSHEFSWNFLVYLPWVHVQRPFYEPFLKPVLHKLPRSYQFMMRTYVSHSLRYQTKSGGLQNKNILLRFRETHRHTKTMDWWDSVEPVINAPPSNMSSRRTTPARPSGKRKRKKTRDLKTRVFCDSIRNGRQLLCKIPWCTPGIISCLPLLWPGILPPFDADTSVQKVLTFTVTVVIASHLFCVKALYPEL